MPHLPDTFSPDRQQGKINVLLFEICRKLFGNKEKIIGMRYIRSKSLPQPVPVSRTTIWRMVREGRLPQSRQIGKVAMARIALGR
jgi:hypothetical protein